MNEPPSSTLRSRSGIVRHARALMLLALVPIMLIALRSRHADEPVHFVTTPGNGPDKWASVWFLERRFGPDTVRLLEPDHGPGLDVVAFDMPDAPYDRSATGTTMAALIEQFEPDGTTARAIARLVHEIEIDAWRSGTSLRASIVERGFRDMQLRYGRTAVTPTCYLRFFDRVAAALVRDALDDATRADELLPGADCLDTNDGHDAPELPAPVVPAAAFETAPVPVDELALDEVLALLADERSVVFVDTREASEFAEGHLPGAVHLPVRRIDAASAARLRAADQVIAYCVKDFRGYEGALALRELGVNAAIMRPYGMRGWVAAGLPTASPDGPGDIDARAELLALARQRQTPPRTPSPGPATGDS